MNCESHERVGLGRRLAVISCAWFCWICVRAALMLGLLASANVIACYKVICVAAGRSRIGVGAAAGEAGCPPCGADWLWPAAEELSGIVVCPGKSGGSIKLKNKRDTRNIVPLQKSYGFYGANLDEWPGSGSGRRTDEETQLGNGALALRFIRDGKSFNGMEDQQQVNRYRGRIRMDRQADNARR